LYFILTQRNPNMTTPSKNAIPLRRNQRNLRLGQIGTDLWSVRVVFSDCLDHASHEVLPIVRPMLEQLDTYAELSSTSRYSIEAFGLYRGDVIRLFPSEDEDGNLCHDMGAHFPCDGSILTDYAVDNHPFVSISASSMQRFALTTRPWPGSPVELRDVTQALDWLAAMIRPREILLGMTLEAENAKVFEQMDRLEQAMAAAVAERQAHNVPLH
jgi:hypothetical protein